MSLVSQFNVVAFYNVQHAYPFLIFLGVMHTENQWPHIVVHGRGSAIKDRSLASHPNLRITGLCMHVPGDLRAASN